MRLELTNDEQQIIAWADIEKNAEGMFELENIGVNPDYRNQGNGQKMLEKIFGWMKQKNVKTLFFLNSNKDFWAEMKKKYPKNIWLSTNLEGTIKVW